MLDVGQKFPDFKLQNQAGEEKTLSHYQGKWLVLYIYPKDDTPGCTIQGKSFTTTKQDFEKNNAVVVGLSADDVTSHKHFCDKYELKVDLLADPKTLLLEKTGVGQKTFKGNLYWNRTTFLMDPMGTIQKVYTNVNPEGHEKIVLDDIQKLNI